MSELYKKIDWICPKCNCKNNDTFLDIETHPVKCMHCKNHFDIFLRARLDVEVIQVSDGSISEFEKIEIFNKLKGGENK